MSDFQFYPTPSYLSDFAVGLFKKTIVALLDPSAGQAALLNAAKAKKHLSNNELFAIEIDPTNQEALRAMGANIIGHDFLQYTNGRIFSHILMNPPFASGVDHVLHAWDILAGGEIVAIVNAETVLNPYSAKRKQFLKLIEDNGHYTVIDDAFAKEKGAVRPADVDVAVIYLSKERDAVEFDFSGNQDTKPSDFKLDNEASSEVGIPISQIQAFVNTFDAAVRAFEASIHAQNAANKLKELLGPSYLEEMASEEAAKTGEKSSFHSHFDKNMGKKFLSGYSQLKESAWWAVIKHAELEKGLTGKNIDRFRNEIDTICSLEFSVSNIYGLLAGFANSKGDLNNKMLMDTFDEISKYHPENRAYFKGWKSNTQHRLDAFKIKAKRFILPIELGFWGNSLTFKALKKLNDLDLAFAYLDGKKVDDAEDLFNGLHKNLDTDLTHIIGKRISTEYFDFRLYSGGTIHLFPRRKDLINRLNTIVGKLRQWLPQDMAEASNDFWEQYDCAEVINGKMSKQNIAGIGEAITAAAHDYQHWNHKSKEQAEKAMLEADKEFCEVAEEMGINITNILGSETHGLPSPIGLTA